MSVLVRPYPHVALITKAQHGRPFILIETPEDVRAVVTGILKIGVAVSVFSVVV